MYGKLVVNSWVGTHEGCDITYNVQGSDAVYATISGKDQPFEFFCQTDALLEFIGQSGKALAEMNVLAEQEDAESNASEQAEIGQAAV